MPCPGSFTVLKEIRCSLYTRLGGLAFTGTRYRDRPARSKSLNRMRYPGCHIQYVPGSFTVKWLGRDT